METITVLGWKNPCAPMEYFIILPAHICWMVVVAQLVRASDCDSEGRGFKSPRSPQFFKWFDRFILSVVGKVAKTQGESIPAVTIELQPEHFPVSR